jgi:hypothetical protein
MDKYEFTTDSLSYGTIEYEILRYYNLGYAHSSTFMDLQLGINREESIFAEKGTINFTAIVGETKDKKYIVTIFLKKSEEIGISSMKKGWLGLLGTLWIPYVANLISLIIKWLNLKLNVIFVFIDFLADMISKIASIPTLKLMDLALYDLSNKLGYYGFLLLLIVATAFTIKNNL